MLHAMVTSALQKLLNTQIHFRKRESVKEQRVQKHDQLLRWRQIAFMICEYFRATGAYEAVQGPSDLVTKSSQNGRRPRFLRTVEKKALLSPSRTPSETPTEMVMEGLYKSKLNDSVQLQTVLALYDQQTVRTNGQPSFKVEDSSKASYCEQYLTRDISRVCNAYTTFPQGPTRLKWKLCVIKCLILMCHPHACISVSPHIRLLFPLCSHLFAHSLHEPLDSPRRKALVCLVAKWISLTEMKALRSAWMLVSIQAQEKKMKSSCLIRTVRNGKKCHKNGSNTWWAKNKVQPCDLEISPKVRVKFQGESLC